MRDRLLLGFTVRLLARSMRWVAPAVLVVLWVLLIVANPGPARANGVAGYPLLLLTGCWLAVVVGNVDDDGHRELCTAIVGSPGRLVATRAGAALAVTLPVGLVAGAALWLVGTGAGPTVGDAVAVVGLQLAGALAGVGIGAVLHRPVVRHAGVTVLGAAVALLGCSVTPPVIRLLRDAGGGQWVAVVVLLAAGATLCASAVAASARLAGRFAR